MQVRDKEDWLDFILKRMLRQKINAGGDKKRKSEMDRNERENIFKNFSDQNSPEKILR